MKRPLACAAMMTVGLFSCSKKKMHDTPIPPPSVSPMPTIAASLVDPATVFCRALKVKGVVTTEGSARTLLHMGDPIAKDTWVTLEPNAELVVKEATSGREGKLSGPAKARLCVGKELQTWLHSGYFDAQSIGSPAAATRILATPYGSVRYSAARVRVTVQGSLDLAVDAGSADVLPSDVPAAKPSAKAEATAAATIDAGARLPPFPNVRTVLSPERVVLHGSLTQASSACAQATSALKAFSGLLEPGKPHFGPSAEALPRAETSRKMACAWSRTATQDTGPTDDL